MTDARLFRPGFLVQHKLRIDRHGLALREAEGHAALRTNLKIAFQRPIIVQGRQKIQIRHAAKRGDPAVSIHARHAQPERG